MGQRGRAGGRSAIRRPSRSTTTCSRTPPTSSKKPPSTTSSGSTKPRRASSTSELIVGAVAPTRCTQLFLGTSRRSHEIPSLLRKTAVRVSRRAWRRRARAPRRRCRRRSCRRPASRRSLTRSRSAAHKAPPQPLPEPSVSLSRRSSCWTTTITQADERTRRGAVCAERAREADDQALGEDPEGSADHPDQQRRPPTEAALDAAAEHREDAQADEAVAEPVLQEGRGEKRPEIDRRHRGSR